jgi:hypothetical protein
MYYVCRVGTEIHLPAAYGYGLGHLIEEFHRKSRYPYSLAWTLDQFARVPTMSTHRLYVILESSEAKARAVGYAWTEILLSGEFWLHQVYTASYSLQEADSPAMMLWDRLCSDAQAAGCSRISGAVHRGVGAALAYCRRWGAEIQSVIVTQQLGGETHGRRTRPSWNSRRSNLPQ